MATAVVGQSGDLVDPNPKNRFQGEESVSNRPGDLFWDQLIKYAASGMILLAAFDIVSSLTSAGVKCLTPDSYSRDQSAFINGFCSEHTPVTDYFLFYLLAQALCIAGPHLFWQAWFSGRLSFFVALALTLDRHRDSKTGEYAQKNYVVAKQLLNAFHCSHYMVFLYVVKLVVQLVLVLGVFAVSLWVFNDYNTIFPCPGQWDSATNRTWPLPTELSCVYSVLRSHQAAWITNYVLLGLALACTVYGLAWCSFSHGSKLNWKEAARFALESGISHNYYHSRGFFKELLRCRNPFHYHIHTDLDFLLLKLFPQDVGCAHVLRDVLIETFLQKEVDAIRQRLNLLRKSEKKKGSVSCKALRKSIMDSKLAVKVPPNRKEDKSGQLAASRWDLGGTMAKFLVNVATATLCDVQVGHQEEVNTKLPRGYRIQDATINLSFGSLGYTHFLAQFCDRVLSLDFHPHLVNEKKPVYYRHFHSEVHNVTVMSNIYALPVHLRNKLDEVLTLNHVLNVKSPNISQRNPPKQIPISLVVVSPFTNLDRIITINWFLYLMTRVRSCCSKDTRLVTFTPVKIGHSAVKFVTFKPTSPWTACDVEFKHVNQAVEIVESNEPQVATATSSGEECSVSFRHTRTSDSQVDKKRHKPEMNCFIKPDPDNVQPNATEKDNKSKNTVVLQCGGIQCTFKVMVYWIPQ